VFYSSSKLSENSFLRFIGVIMAYLVIGADTRKEHMISLAAKFPLLFCWKMLLVELIFCQYPRCWPGITLIWGNITVRTIVPKDARVIQAAKNGDLDTVRALINCGLAGPNDASDDFDCPLIAVSTKKSTNFTAPVLI
jgi:hypothetical protein